MVLSSHLQGHLVVMFVVDKITKILFKIQSQMVDPLLHIQLLLI